MTIAENASDKQMVSFPRIFMLLLNIAQVSVNVMVGVDEEKLRHQM